jgi:hypothetical protein
MAAPKEYATPLPQALNAWAIALPVPMHAFLRLLFRCKSRFEN